MMKTARSILCLLLAAVFLAALIPGCSCGGNSEGSASTHRKEISRKGSLLGNEWSFVDESGNELHFPEDESSVLSTAYFKAISYEVKSIDEKNMMAVVEFRIPLLSQPFEKAIESVSVDDAQGDYNTYYDMVSKKAAELIGSDDVQYITSELTLPLERVNGALRLCVNMELSELITGNIEQTLLEGYEKIAEDLENDEV